MRHRQSPAGLKGAYNVECISAYPKSICKVVHQLIDVALVVEEVWVLIVNVPAFPFSGMNRDEVSVAGLPLGDQMAGDQRLASQLHDPYHPGCQFGERRQWMWMGNS